MKKIARKFLKVCSSTALFTTTVSCFQIALDAGTDTISRVLFVAFGLVFLIANYFVWEVELK